MELADYREKRDFRYLQNNNNKYKMAPCPEEIDVFTVPHSRMKELVCQYLDMVKGFYIKFFIERNRFGTNIVKRERHF